jgi:cyclopropane fatty-acyl-phospholipid synthase-like methyltransferase
VAGTNRIDAGVLAFGNRHAEALKLQVPLPFSEACERNKAPILAVLREVFAGRTRVVEIGSGTGQHAVHFARHLPHLSWQPTDRREYLTGLAARIEAEGTSNLRPPLELDVRQPEWPPLDADAVFSANTLHIMGWPEVEAFFRGAGRLLSGGGTLAVYGPFRYRKTYTSQSNADFDRMLRERDAASGIRDFEAVDRLAARAGLEFQRDVTMPANNQLLVWHRVLGSAS